MKKKLAILAATAAMSATMAFAGSASADVRFNDDRADRVEDRAEIIEDYYDALGLDVDDDILLYYGGHLGWWF